MKLRIKGNSLRLRLTKPEVRMISEGKVIDERICFGPASKEEAMIYRLQTSREISHICASFHKNMITVQLPWNLALDWATTDQVSLREEQQIGKDEPLRLLIEKDFFCLKPRQHGDEDESEMFENPGLAHGKCGGHSS